MNICGTAMGTFLNYAKQYRFDIGHMKRKLNRYRLPRPPGKHYEQAIAHRHSTSI